MEPTRTDVLNLLYEHPVEVGHWVGFNDLTDLHNEWLRSFLFNDEDMTLQAHRGSFKTTTLSLFFALHSVIKPNESVMYFRKTDTDVQEIARQTQRILLSGAVQKIVRILYGHELEMVKLSSSEIDTNLHTSINGASQIVGLGIGTSITGKHSDIVVTDDIVNVKDRVSHAEREATKRQYMELQNICNRGGRFINTGTPWHKDDAFTLMPNIERYDCYSTGLIDTEKLHDLQGRMSSSLFAANYELKHIADADSLFDEPQYTSDVESLYDGIAHIDAAYGGEDYTAYTIMKRTADGIVAFGKIWPKHVDDCLDEIQLLHEKYRAGSISVETNGDKGYLAKELRSRGFRTNSYHEKANKYIKISTYLKCEWPNIKWIDMTDPSYIGQILDYTENAEHDDAPDSAACLVRKLSKTAQDSDYVPLLNRQMGIGYRP